MKCGGLDVHARSKEGRSMPWSIRKGADSCRADQWAVVNADTGAARGCHDTRRAAQAQLAVLNPITETYTSPSTGDAMPDTLQLRETTAATLSEAAVNERGQVLLRLIAPGWSANGRYYSDDVLKSSGLRAFREGLHTYVDHPRRSDEVDRPERSVRDLVGSLTENAYYDPRGPAGAGLYAHADVREEYRPLVDELAGVVGMSIRADGTGHHGEAAGRQGTIVDTIESADSVDYVTSPAAGGRVIQLIESVQNPDRETEPPPNVVMAKLTPEQASAMAKLTPEQASAYAEAMRNAGNTEVADKLQEARNIGQWLEARIHSMFTEIADGMYGDGLLTREERVALSGAIGDALEAFTARVEADAPNVFSRDLFDSPDPEPTEMSESTAATEPEASTTTETTETSPAEAGKTADLASAPTDVDSEEETMTETTGAGTAPAPLSTSRQLIEAELAQERQARALAEARERARQVLGTALAEAWVPPATAHRITESLLADLPLTADTRQLDETKLIEAARRQLEQAETEMAEALSAAGVGRPRDLGYRPEDGSYAPVAEQYDTQLTETFRRLGMSESAAKLAAEGRV